MADDVTVDAEASQEVEESPEQEEKLDLDLQITDVGPCQKHVKVTIPRAEIERFFDKEFSDLVRSANVPGFRPGKTPRKLIERKFKKDVAQQVKAALLTQSLDQIDKDERIQPLSEPEIDVASIELPEEGDFSFQFDVEVRPEFDLPEYKGLTIERPTREFSDADIEVSLKDFLKGWSTVEPKDGPAEPGDRIVADVRFLHQKEVLQEIEDLELLVDEELAFRDGRIEKFAQALKGKKAGDSVELTATLSDAVEREELRGKDVKAEFVLKEIRRVKPPEVNEEFLSRLGMSDEGEFKDFALERLKSRLAYAQEETAREQVMNHLVSSADWQLPPNLLRRQTERALSRKILELESRGFSKDEIRARINTLRQNSLVSTARSLKQQFVLQRIAEVEEIKVEEEDLDREIRALADRTGQPIRRVRARIDKEGLWETLALLALERKTIERVLSFAKSVDVLYEPPILRASGLDASAVPPPEPAVPGEESEQATG